MNKIYYILIILILFLSCNNDRIGFIINKTVVEPYYEEKYYDTTYFINISDDPFEKMEVGRTDYYKCDAGDSIIIINNKLYIFK